MTKSRGTVTQRKGFAGVCKTQGSPKAERAIKPGDVVRLKSGSPHMTVQRICANEKCQLVAECIWFDPRATSFPVDQGIEFYEHTAEIAVECLVKVKA